MQSIIVRHNVEMGHRLSLQPDSKCFHLHGHSWWIDLEISGPLDDKGMILNFADVKRTWRGYLDSYFDHHMCLNETDPLVGCIVVACGGAEDAVEEVHIDASKEILDAWGVQLLNMDPTVENMAKLWGQHARHTFGPQYDYYIKVQEAAVNAATWRSVAR